MQPAFDTWIAADGTVVTIRPITTADLELEQQFLDRLSAPTAYQRFMSLRPRSPEEIRRFTDINRERELALIATTPHDGKPRQIAVARYVKERDSDQAEFAIVLSDEWQGRGLGRRLMVDLLIAAKTHGVRTMTGSTLSENDGMLTLSRKLGFAQMREPGVPSVKNLTLDLGAWEPPGQE